MHVRWAQNSERAITYHMYLASGRRLSYTPCVERVVETHKMQPVSSANFPIHYAHMRKDA